MEALEKLKSRNRKNKIYSLQQLKLKYDNKNNNLIITSNSINKKIEKILLTE